MRPPRNCLRRSIAESQAAADPKAFEEFRNRWMARKNGLLSQVNDLWLKAAPGPAKREVGQRVNALKLQAEDPGRRGRATRCRLSSSRPAQVRDD